MQIVANTVQEKQRSGQWRLSRNGCQDSQGTAEVAVPGPSPALGSCQGRGRAGKRQRQPRELPALSTELKLKLCRAPSSPELREHRDSSGTKAALQPVLLWASLSTRAGLQLLLALLSSKDTVKCGLHQQGGKSIQTMPTLQCAFPLPCTFTSNYSAFQPWKTNFTQFHSKSYLSLYEWLQYIGACFGFLLVFFFYQEINI